jgi:hypothetical protein
MMATPWLTGAGAVGHKRIRWTVEANVAARNKQKCRREERGWGGGQKQNVDGWFIRIPYAPNNDTGCEKTVYVEIAIQIV